MSVGDGSFSSSSSTTSVPVQFLNWRKEREARPLGWGVSQSHPGLSARLQVPGVGLTATVVHQPAGLQAPDLLSSVLQNHPLS